MGNYRDPCDPSDEDWGAEPETRILTVDTAGHAQRLDKVLAVGVPEFSRNYLKKAIEEGQVLVGGQQVSSPSKKVIAGQRIEVQLLPTAQSLSFRGEPVPIDVVFEDEHLLVVHKPAGLVVHPGAGNWSGTLLNGLLFRDPQSGALPRAGIVHRLDKDTSGLMVVGRTLRAVTELTRQIAAREVHREYLALAHGHLQQDQQIQKPIARDPKWRTKMAVVSSGKPAHTDVFVLGHGLEATALRCVLHTGRTHQIRVHLAHLGHPLVGDQTYGGRSALGLQRQALHAWKLRLNHPILRQPMEFLNLPPEDLVQVWRRVMDGFAPVF